jgi:hypothetical protein
VRRLTFHLDDGYTMKRMQRQERRQRKSQLAEVCRHHVSGKVDAEGVAVGLVERFRFLIPARRAFTGLYPVE